MKYPKIAILISGRGSNMIAIAEAVRDGRLNADVVFVGSDVANAPGLSAAKNLGIKTVVFPYAIPPYPPFDEETKRPTQLAKNARWSSAYHKGGGKEIAEAEILQALRAEKIDWLVLAGFMRILSPRFVENMKGRIINIHPSLLPSFKGAHAIQDAFEYGVKITGVTVHIVDEFVDNGEILAQSPVKIEENDTLESLSEKIHKTEHELYTKTLTELFRRMEMTRC